MVASTGTFSSAEIIIRPLTATIYNYRNELFMYYVYITSREIKKIVITTNSEIDLELADAIFF